MRRLYTPGRLAAAALVLLALLVGVLLLAPARDTYIFLPDRAHPVDPLVKVEGGTSPRDGGGIFFVDVIVRQATWMERLFPSIREGSTLVPAHAIRPPGVSEDDRRRGNLREMTRSQSVAAAVALRELGFDVKADPTGALVRDVIPGAPAAGKLQPTDVVVAVDSERVRTPSDLRRLIGRTKPGASITLEVRRGGKLERISITTIADPDRRDRAVVGVLVDQAADIRLPISVRIDAGDVGGPSAGLAFALDVMEELGRDVDRGYRVAVTGEIELDGDVNPVGGLRQKTIGARRTNVDIFLVPAGDNAEEARRYADDVRIIPVKTFQQALRALATLPLKKQN
ncbi:MAG: YlbL family protein [Gaiellaceae bacterium]